MTTFNESYPNIGYVLNRLADIADTKTLATKGTSRYRKEEDFSNRKSLDPNLIGESVRHLFYEPISVKVTEHFAEFFCDCIWVGLNNYIGLIRHVPMEGIKQNKVVHMLNKYLFVETLANIVWKVGVTQMPTNQVPSFYCDRNPVKTLIEFHNNQHNLPENLINKHFEDIERTVRKWRSGETIPNIGNLSLLADWASLSNPNAISEDKVTFFLARFIDSFHRKTNYQFVLDLKKAVMWRLQHNCEPQLNLAKIFYKFYINEIKSAGLYGLAIEGDKLRKDLRRSIPKPPGSLRELAIRLSSLQKSVKKHNLEEELLYHFYWLQGRLLIMSGQIDKAVGYYRHAVESSLYKSGDNIKDLLKEALAIEAIQHKPNKISMKKIKSRALTFCYKIIDPHHRNLPVSITHEDIVEWRFWFLMNFKHSGWFEEGKETLEVHLKEIQLLT